MRKSAPAEGLRGANENFYLLDGKIAEMKFELRHGKHPVVNPRCTAFNYV